jgi:biotin carboxyl carrier protein
MVDAKSPMAYLSAVTGSARFVVRVDDRTHDVEVHEDGRVTVDGEPHEAVPLEPSLQGAISVRGPDGRQWRVDLGGAPRPTQAAVGGRGASRHEVQIRTVAEAALDDALGVGAAGPNDGNLVAPMPGRVVAISVAEGDVVSAGDPAIVIEAMKMENELAAPCSGRVGQVAVSAGDAVDAGQLLIAFVPDETDETDETDPA